MKPFRETRLYDPLFPFILMHKEIRDPNTEPDTHFHDWYEIVFVHEGEGTFFIDREFYPMQTGDLFLLTGNIIHRAIPRSDNPYTVSVILFHPGLVHKIPLGEPYSYLEAFEQSEYGRCQTPIVHDKLDRRLKRLLSDMQRELTDPTPGSRHAVLSLFHYLLVDIARHFSSALPRGPIKVSKSQLWMKDILSYIDTHLAERISLLHLSQQALVSPEHFSRVFKQMTGYHLPDYLNAKRILAVRDQLIQTDLPVAEIGHMCGFESISHFHRIFKKQLQCTPAQFRKKYRNAGERS